MARLAQCHFCAIARCPVESVANALNARDSDPLIDLRQAALGRNFLAMPPILKLITVTALGALIPVTTTVLPNFPAGVFGLFNRHISTSEWWSSGGGKLVLVATALFCASAVMMLRRSRYGRLIYIAALITMCMAIPIVAGVVGMDVVEWRFLLAVNLAWTVGLALYLYLDMSTRDYFRTVG
jgi:hypothetical protein